MVARRDRVKVRETMGDRKSTMSLQGWIHGESRGPSPGSDLDEKM